MMEKNMEIQTIIAETKSPLMKWVAEDILESSEGYDTIKTRIIDIVEHGCESGTVGSLVYYTDTESFYDKFEDEIDDLVEDLDYKVNDYKRYKNELAWLAYEYIAQRLLENIQ